MFDTGARRFVFAMHPHGPLPAFASVLIAQVGDPAHAREREMDVGHVSCLTL